MKNETKKMQIVAAITRTTEDGKRNFWTKIGVAFQNRDGSFKLRFDYLPAQLGETTIQLREFPAKKSEEAAV